jgi:hypothetical protein
MALFDRFKTGLQKFGQGVKDTFGSAAKVFKTTASTFNQPKSDLDYGFSSNTTRMTMPSQPKAKPKALEFKIGAGTKPPPVLPGPRIIKPTAAQTAVQRQIDIGKKANAPKPLPIPEGIKKIARDVAPETVAAINRARNQSASTPARVAAGGESALRAAQELILQPIARLGTQLTRNITTGGADAGFTPESTLGKFFLGRQKVEGLAQELGELPKMGYELAGQLPTVKMLPKGSASAEIARYGLALPAALFSGGLKALDIDVGIGSGAKKVVGGVVKEGAERMAREGAERLLREGAEELGERGARELLEAGEREIVGDFAPSLGRAIHPEDTARMTEYIDNVRLKGPVDKQLELDATRIAEEYGMNMPKSKAKLADEFDNVLTETRTAKKTVPPPVKTAVKELAETEDNVARKAADELLGRTDNVAAKVADDVPLPKPSAVIQKKLDDLGWLDEAMSAGAKVDDKGMVTVFHRTTPENAEAILSTGKMSGKEDGLFFSTKPDGQNAGYGTAVVEMKIPAWKLELDDVFDGEAHLRLPTDSAGRVVDVSEFVPRTEFEEALGKVGQDQFLERTRLQREGINPNTVDVRKPKETKIVPQKEPAALDMEVQTIQPKTIDAIMAKIGREDTVNRAELSRIIAKLDVPAAEKKAIARAVKVIEGDEIPTEDVFNIIERSFGARQFAGAGAGVTPEFDEQGNFKGIGYNPAMGALGFVGMTAAESKMGKQALRQLNDARKQYIDKFLAETVEGADVLARFEQGKGAFDQAKEYLDNPAIQKAIRGTPYFRKEGTILDEMGRGVVLEKSGRSMIEADPVKIDAAVKNGWKKGASVDQLAQEAGFDRGEDYLNAVLDTGANKPPKDARAAAHAYLAKNDPQYVALADTVESAKSGAVRPEEVAFRGEGAPSPDELTKALEPGYKSSKLGFTQTVKESGLTSPEMANRLIDTEGRVLNNKDMIESARALLANNRDEAIRMVRDPQETTPLSNTVGQLLMKEYQDAGRFEEAIDTVDILARKARTAGQAVQALSIWGRLTPEGALAYTQRIINEANRVGRGGLKLTEEAAKDITEQAKNLAKMPEGRAKTIATAKLLDTMGSQIPPTTLAKISSIQTMAQLLNPKTVIRNLVGNAGFSALEQATDVLGSAVDLGVSLITKRRTKVLPSMAAQARGLKEGWKLGLEDALRGVDTSGVLSKHEGVLKSAGGAAGRIWKTGPLAHVEKGLNVILRAPDRAFYQAAYEGTVDNLLRANGFRTLEEAGPELSRFIQEAAHAEGLRRTFQDDNVLSKVMSGIKRTLNANKDWGVGDLLIKYPKTPAAIVMRGLEYTPMAFAQAAWELAKPLIGKDVTKKTFNQRKFVEALSRGAVGTGGLVGVGALMHKLGIIRGKEDRPDDVKSIERAQGIQDYQINASALKRFFMGGMDPNAAKAQPGDVLTSYDWFQPVSIMLAMGADIDRAKGENKGTVGGILGMLERYGEGMLQGIDTLSEQPLFTGVRRFAQSRSFPDAVRTTLVGMPSSFVPTFLNQVKQLTDNVSRETYDPSMFKEALNRAIYKIPGVAGTLPERVTPFGETQQIYQDGTNTLANVFVNPAFVNKLKELPEAKMVLDLYELTGERRQVPNLANRSQTAYGQDFKLDAQGISDMQRYMGVETQKVFSKLAQNEKFQKLPSDKQIQLLTKVLTSVGSEAKTAAYFQHIGVTPPTTLPVPAQAKLMKKLYAKPAFKKLSPEKQKILIERLFRKLDEKAPE